MTKFEFLRVIEGPGRPLSDETLNHQDAIVGMLLETPEMPNAEAARQLGLSALRTAQICDGLASRGFITTSRNHRGGRVYTLTKTGKTLAQNGATA